MKARIIGSVYNKIIYDEICRMTLEEFEKSLRGADWHYEYSDDRSVYKMGSARMAILERIAREGGKEFQELFDKIKLEKKAR